MLYREIIAVCSEIHTKHINTLCGQNVGFVYVIQCGQSVQLLNVKLSVHYVNSRLYKVKFVS